MRRGLALGLLAVAACASGPPEGPVTLGSLPDERREAYLREATVWSPIDTAALDLRKGPPGGDWPPGVSLDCEFVLPPEKPSGYTPKFLCRAGDGRTYKIKYGRDNREVYGEVIGSRLLWALGFRSDRIDPVLVRCRGCPEDPWKFMQGGLFEKPEERPDPGVVRSFEPAIIETYHGTLMESDPEQGVGWDELLELTSADPARAREQKVHREALALLAGLLQHADSKPSQQTLSCAPGAVSRDASGAETCTAPEIYVGDVGAILGDGWKYKRASTTKIEWALWKKTPVWRDGEPCFVAVNGRPNASLHDVRISEAGRLFLVRRLLLLSRDQLVALFSVARVELLEEEIEPEPGVVRKATAEDWADLFREKAARIDASRCAPSAATG